MLIGTKADQGLDHIEILMARDEPIKKVLRLLCLQSLVVSGLKDNVLCFFKRELL